MNFDFYSFDLQILKFINKPISAEINTIFLLLSYSIYGFLLFIGYYYFHHKKYSKFIHLFITAVIGFIFVTALKQIIARPRPYISFPNEVVNLLYGVDPSFPSRHAFVAFLLLRFLPNYSAKIWRYLNILYLFSIPFVQMYIGVHYPTDVIGGLLIGFMLPTLVTEKASQKILTLILNFLRKFKPTSRNVRV
jgi:undecaprenyl-diphosphatase